MYILNIRQIRVTSFIIDLKGYSFNIHLASCPGRIDIQFIRQYIMLDKQKFNSIAQVILYEYNSGTIASERHLQALLFNLIRPILSENLTLLVEPNIITQDKNCEINGLIPDMLIIEHAKQLLQTVVEIKYVPYGYPKYQKDFETFVAFHSSINKDNVKIYLKGQPKDGNWDTDILYEVAKDLQLIYIVIARFDAELFEKTTDILNKYFDDSEKFTFQSLFILINPDKDPKTSEIRIKAE